MIIVDLLEADSPRDFGSRATSDLLLFFQQQAGVRKVALIRF